MACGVIQVVLKKVANVIQETSKGDKIQILAISFLVNKIRLNGMSRNFGLYDDYFRAIQLWFRAT